MLIGWLWLDECVSTNVWLIIVGYILGSIGDVYTTYKYAFHSTGFIELNGYIVHFYDMYGLLGLFLVKLLFIPLLALFTILAIYIYKIAGSKCFLLYIYTVSMLVVFSAPVIHNLLVVMR